MGARLVLEFSRISGEQRAVRDNHERCAHPDLVHPSLVGELDRTPSDRSCKLVFLINAPAERTVLRDARPVAAAERQIPAKGMGIDNESDQVS